MVLWVGVRDIPYGFMGGCRRYTLTVLWVGVGDIPYGFMGGCKRYTLWFYGWV